NAIQELLRLAANFHPLRRDDSAAVLRAEGEGGGPAGRAHRDLNLQRAFLRPRRHLAAEPFDTLFFAVILGHLAELAGTFRGGRFDDEVGSLEVGGAGGGRGEPDECEREGEPTKRHSLDLRWSGRRTDHRRRPVADARASEVYSQAVCRERELNEARGKV